MSPSILAIAEHRAGKLKAISWETIGFSQSVARALNKELKIVVLGDATDELAREIANLSGETVLLLQHQLLADYTPEIYCEALAHLVSQENPYLCLMGHTYQVMDFAPRLAGRLDRGLVPNCVNFQLEGGIPVFTRQVYYGKLDLRVGLKGDPPYFVSLQQGAFAGCEIVPAHSPQVVKVELPLSEALMRRKLQQVVQAVQGDVDLSQAEVIVAGGRGLGSKEKFQIILDLAKVLGAGVGASRPVTDAAWLPKEHQIGSSGQSVSPKLYIACGISGAIQHLVGMTNSGCVVAINKDPNAPIFSVADYGIVGDVFQIVPVLTELFREVRQKA